MCETLIMLSHKHLYNMPRTANYQKLKLMGKDGLTTLFHEPFRSGSDLWSNVAKPSKSKFLGL